MRYLLPLLLLAGLPASPARAERPIVVELFTSQGCSSCPPADALLAEIAQAPGVLALGFHVTYWDRLGWKDPYALPQSTERQRASRARFGLDYVYTPQMIVDGRLQAVGSDRAEVAAALRRARETVGVPVPLALSGGDGGLVLRAGAGEGRGTVLLVGFDPEHVTPVRAGENGGRTLREVNVVRSVVEAGAWGGAAAEWRVARPAGARMAAVLQAPDGRVLGAALLP